MSVTINPLPILMVAPNGARKTKIDHPALPVSIPETIAVAKECFDAGANALHLHVRDKDGGHTLDSSLYLQAIAELKQVVPDMAVQITTESVGIYSAPEQRDVVRALHPDLLSVSLAEMLSDGDTVAATSFYQWCHQESMALQHILYNEEDLHTLGEMLANGSIPTDNLQLLFVLGRYSSNQESHRDDLLPFTQWLEDNDVNADWALCAFGKNESDCLKFGLELGGKVRVGFENSFWNSDGSQASGNPQRVSEIKSLVDRHYVHK